jgi:hypothetical protein
MENKPSSLADIMARYMKLKAALDEAAGKANLTKEAWENANADLAKKQGEMETAQKNLGDATGILPEEAADRAENFITLVKAFNEAEDEANSATETNDIAIADLAIKQGEFDLINDQIKQTFGEGINFEALADLGDRLQEAIDRAETAEKEAVADRERAILYPPKEIRTVRDPTTEEVKQAAIAYLNTPEGKKLNVPEDYQAIKNRLTGIEGDLKSAAGIKKLLAEADKDALAAYLAENTPKPTEVNFDPTKITDEQVAKIPPEKIATFIVNNAGNVEMQTAIEIIKPKRDWLAPLRGKEKNEPNKRRKY